MREGSWALARDCFAAADTAEAFEGLSWAAWWLDDAETVFSAREHAYRLFLERGEPAAAARMATWIGADQNDFHGATAVASGWFERARRLLDPLPAGPDRGWLAFHTGYVQHRAGEAQAARARAREAADIGRAFGVPDLEMLGLALEGASLVAGAEVGEGMRRLDEATVTALDGRAQIPISGAWACCFLVSACLSVYDFERAFAWSDRIAAFADRYGSRWMLAFCRAEYGAIDRWRGRWPQAEALLEASIEDFAHSRPAWTPGPLTGLAERLLRHAGPEGRLDRVGPLELRIRAQLKGALTPFRKVEGWLRELRQLAGRAAAATREREAANRALNELGADRPPLPELTPREREVLTLLAQGLTNRQLAEQLVVSEHTVHRHVTNILRKLDAPSRAAAAALAARHGLI